MAGRGFGSFHTQDVQLLVGQADKDYTQPPQPVQPRHLTSAPAFGRQAREELFLLDAQWTFVNHGAFGAACRPAFEVAQEWQRYLEAQPLRFIDRVLLPALVYSTRCLATALGARGQDLVLVANASTGLSAVFSSLQLGVGDVLYALDTAYGSVKKMARECCVRTGATYHEQHLQFPIAGPDELVQLIDGSLPPNTKVAVLDHISSNTAILFPLERLVALCHARGIVVVVDGAHGPGQTELDLGALGADYYVGNAHKWLCAPKGVGFVHVQEQHQGTLHPATISHGWGRGLTSEFVWQGTSDYSAQLALPTALNMWQDWGWAHVRSHNRSLLCKAVALLVAAWATDTLVPLELTAWMALVRVPAPEGQGGGWSSEDGNALQDALFFDHTIEAPIKHVQGQLYVRLSVHVYNTLADYSALAQALPRALLGLRPR